MLWLHLSILFFLILLNGFFAMAEIALVSARPARLQPLAGAGSAGARAAIELKADPSRLLATVQIGVTVIAILSGTFGQDTLGEPLEAWLDTLHGFAPYAHVAAMVVVVIGIAYFSLIIGELAPKRIALGDAEGIASHLVISLDTVKKHVSHLMGKLGAANRTEAVARGRELGLID